jgi:hypothetical protein
MSSFVVYEVWLFVLSCRILKWVRKYWSTRGTKVLDPLRACVNVVASYCDPSFPSILTYVKSLVMYVESIFATVSEQFAVVDCCLLF